MRRFPGLVLALFGFLSVVESADPALPIGVIDFYGLGGLPAERVRSALTFKEGDTISPDADGPPAFIAASEARLATLPEVQRGRIDLVCCDEGRVIAYVGLERRGSTKRSFRAAPDGGARLAADIVSAGDEFSKALTRAAERGDTTEDRSQGHALNHDPAMRAVQDRFIAYASRDLPALRRVLRTSSDAAQRALAAQVLPYAADKAAIVDDLVYGTSDPAEGVRNSAIRALWVLAEMVPSAQRKAVPIPATPFVELLNSPVWSDRNKASGALEALTRRRNPGVLGALRRQAIDPLVEIARWKTEGHALLGFLVLARIAGYSDDAAHDLWKRGERETVIKAAVATNR
jgi:hypothetical protein